jgi:ATP-dependent protease ClpP protease subunit
MKEILLYFPIYSSTAASFINEMEANKGNDVCIRMNCPGGDVMAAMGMIAKYNEHTGRKSVKVDGRAASMAAYFCAMADNVECLDSSEFLIHRAAFPDFVENDKNQFTDEMKAMLTRHNGILRASLENKIDPAKFKRTTGKSFDDVFSLDNRIDITLNSKQAKDLGLVNNILPLNIAKKREINALAIGAGISAFYDEGQTTTEAFINSENKNKMTVADVKANSEVYAAIKAEVLAEEKDRIDSFAAFAEYAPAKVLEAIVKGEKYTNAFGAQVTAASIKNAGITNVTTATATTVTTAEVSTETPAEAQAKADEAAFWDSIKRNSLSTFGVVPTA